MRLLILAHQLQDEVDDMLNKPSLSSTTDTEDLERESFILLLRSSNS